MSTELATTKLNPSNSPLMALANRLNSEPTRLLKVLQSTVFRDARSEEEVQALIIVANQYDLNPLLKELYAFPAKGGGIVPMVPVDGWIKLVNTHPQMDGCDFEDIHQDGKLFACKCSIYRKDRSRPTVVTEYLSECKRNTEPWKMEHRMLRHKAFIQAARVAFGFGGLHDEDEAAQIRDVTTQAPPPPKLFNKPDAPAAPAPVVEADMFPTEAPSVPLLDQVRSWLSEEDFANIRQEFLDSGLLDDARATIGDCTDDELVRINSSKNAILARLGKGGGK